MKEDKTNKQGFRVPENYLGNMQQEMRNRARNERAFLVPEGYFDSVKRKIKHESKETFILQPKKRKNIWLVATLAAASLIFGFIWWESLADTSRIQPNANKQEIALELIEDIYLEEDSPLLAAQEIAPSWVEEETAHVTLESTLENKPNPEPDFVNEKPALESIYDLYLEEDDTLMPPTKEELLEAVYF